MNLNSLNRETGGSTALYMRGKIITRQRKFSIHTPGIMKIAKFSGGVEKAFDPLDAIALSDGINYIAFFDADYGVQLKLSDVLKGVTEDTKAAINKTLHAQNVLYAEKANAKIFEEKKKDSIWKNPWVMPLIMGVMMLIMGFVIGNALNGLRLISVSCNSGVQSQATANMTQGGTLAQSETNAVQGLYNVTAHSIGG